MGLLSARGRSERSSVMSLCSREADSHTPKLPPLSLQRPKTLEVEVSPYLLLTALPWASQEESRDEAVCGSLYMWGDCCVIPQGGDRE